MSYCGGWVIGRGGGFGEREIGFVLGLFSRSPEARFIVVVLCGKEGCIDFVLLRFGFVLHKK